ncbi:hypothetical protein OKW40_000732 [Paraburkholderia sp. RAU6.4a]
MTNQTQLFEAALGIKAPWYVQGVDFGAELTIAVDFVAGSRFAYPGVPGEADRIELLQEAREASGVAVVGCRGQEQPVLEPEGEQMQHVGKVTVLPKVRNKSVSGHTLWRATSQYR